MSGSLHFDFSKIAFASIILFLLMGQVLCTIPTSSAEEKTTARIGILAEPTSMMPWTEYGVANVYFFLYYDRLIVYDQELKPAPSLAKSWETSSDGRTWTFHIVDNATWQDGEKVTAKDVLFTMNFLNRTEISHDKYQSYLSQIESMEIPDDYTFVVHTHEAYAPSYLVAQFPTEVPIVPEHIWSKMSAEDALKSENRIGSGSYKFVVWKKGEYIQLDKNKNWWDTSRMPTVDSLVYVYYANPETMIQALKQGQIDIVSSVPPNVVNDLMADPNIRVRITPSLYLNEMAFNVYAEGQHVRPSLLDKRLRIALSHAVDKEAMLDMVHLGYGTVGDSIIHGPSPWYNNKLKPFEFNLTLASQMLTEAGYIDRDNDGIRETPDGKSKLDFTVLVCTDVARELRSTELIKGWWQQIGVNLKVTLMDGGTIGGLNYGEDGKNFDFDMFVWSWSAGEVDPNTQLYILTSDSIGSWSETGWHNDEYDRLYKEQMVAPTDTQRKQIIDRMQELEYYDAPYIVYYYLNGIDAYRADRWQPLADFPFGSGAYGFNQFNQWVFWKLTPIATVSEMVQKPVDNTPWIIAGVMTTIAVILAVAVVVIRRKRA